MYVIQNFSSQMITKINPFDKLIWLVGLISYKSLGYKTKLYCEKKDIQFLKDNYLFQYYDEIDTDSIKNCKWLYGINQKYFWFFRKIIAIEHEFELGNEFFYSDTDIILNTCPKFNNFDVYVWWKETHSNNETVYLDWKELSKPKNYIMPDYIKNTSSDNWNCGILYIKDINIFKKWKHEMIAFAKDNPCEIYNESLNKSDSIFACNCEQRILKGITNLLNLQVGVFDTNPKSNGITKEGIHFFFWRYCWRTMHTRLQWASENNPAQKHQIDRENIFLIWALKDFIKDLLNKLKENNFINEYTFFLNNEDIYKLLQFDEIYTKILNWYK